MPLFRRPHGQKAPARDQVNTRIRILMDQPESAERSEEYQSLLRTWAEATRSDVEPAA
ncbi:hypothetical protein [Streptomyces sp. Act143]|uniref:hypothetical protein n=1 Tax=Streptomyces sp. Act143 TaxID=2200760 RepID=UPI0015E8273C|nr:hypothetical protein [Streptomyces sp. Act143]